MAQPRNVLLGSLIIVMFVISYTSANNILVNPMIGKGSHFYTSAAIGEQLIHRGYNVTFLLGSAFENHARSSRYGHMFHWEVFKHPIPTQAVHDMFANLSKLISDSARDVTYELPVQSVLQEARLNDCRALLEDEALIGRLRAANFSAVLFDYTWVCGAMVGELLDLPYFVFFIFPYSCHVTSIEGSSFHPAYIPSMMTSYSNKMNFKERVINSLVYTLLEKILGPNLVAPYKELTLRFGIPDPLELLTNSKLWLVNSDFVGEFPCAFAPNVIQVGGLTTRAAEELPADIEDFIQGSGDDGIIICAFGTFLILDDSNLHVIRIFAEAFDRLPQRVIWLLKTPPPFPIPANIKILPWLPQNDILGHPQTRALFFHGGQNSYYEAIYHGVPVVVMPIFGDQNDVATRIVHHGLGLKLDKGFMNAENLYDALHEVTTNATYTKTAKRMSSAFQDRPMRPAERAAFWIDHAIKHGTNNLEIPVHTLNPFQYYLIDVISFILVVVFFFFYIVFKCCMLICSKACNCYIKSKID
ncbi:UDP-glucuronosyltransferase [Strongylocentrotus purpuratus]|uniref:Glucuronosyltransferase n=1 Tax=Strongylocentrotus purpuratus TaxID=7668 RepID=A0A7M7HQN4_STRPU|nr:UDP-glucuronosyltransferase [Strongylocentrotus purpuratus]